MKATEYGAPIFFFIKINKFWKSPKTEYKKHFNLWKFSPDLACVPKQEPRNTFTCAQPLDFWWVFLWILLILLEKGFVYFPSFTASAFWAPASVLWFPCGLPPALHQCRTERDCWMQGQVPPDSACYLDRCASDTERHQSLPDAQSRIKMIWFCLGGHW